MPFSIRKIGKNKYQVYNTATGEIHSKGTTKKKAEGQFRLLQGIHRNELIDLEGGKWNFSNRNYNPITLGYNALLNGLTENYRSDITKEGVRQDVDRNIEQAKKFAKNPNPITFAKNEAEGQFSRYGSGFYTIPSLEYQPRRFL